MADAAASLKRTPFHDLHAGLGAKLVPFAGYEMPVQYPTGITAEHKAVRSGCGMFDVSHMGEFIISGPGAVAFVNHVTTNDVAALAVGQAHYSTITRDDGTIVDDCLVYRYEDRVMMVVNGSNKDKDWTHIAQHAPHFDVRMVDRTEDIALLAVQGPKAAEILQALTATDLRTIKYYHFAEGAVGDIPATISRTGYTGEDGFELYFDSAQSARMWEALMATGRITPCGLGCRDTLRLEMGMALYGNDIDDTTTPLEAGLGWLVKLKKGDFVGRAALQAMKDAGLPRRLVGFTSAERAFPRHGYPVWYEGRQSGVVCSGTMSPSLEIPIGTCYLPLPVVPEGTMFEIEIRGKRVPATVVKTPFYKDGTHL
jgi:aminomethyltransferase